MVVDLTFFTANISKITHGAWFPLVVGLVVFTCMTTWKRGRSLLYEKLYAPSPSLAEFVAQADTIAPTRVDGQAVYMSGESNRVPPALLHNVRHNKVVHSRVAFVNIVTEDVSRIARDEKVRVEDLGHGFYLIVARYGFMEEPNVPHVLAIAREQGLDFDVEQTSFFLGRERIVVDRRPLMPVWLEKLFAFMSRNALGATTFFHIPPDRVIEIGAQVRI